MKSNKYLDDIIQKFNLKNDAELARHMNWATSKISQYRTGKRMMDNDACLEVAMQLDIDPIKVIMASEIDRAEKTGQHSLWQVFSSRTSIAASVLAMVAVNLILTPTPSEAATVLKPAPVVFILC
jgi:hypothetical protein